jgi:hypothetical protein
MVIEDLKNAFWGAVVDCLVQFHGLSAGEANTRASALRSDLELALGTKFEPGLIYHDEPFYIASRLAGNELNLEAHWEDYRAILARRYGPVEAEMATSGGFASQISTSDRAQGGW